MEFPKLRNVNVFPVQMSGEAYLCVQDPQNISEKALFLPPPVYFIVSLFDGEHSVLDIQAEYMRRFGDILYAEKIRQIIDQLEEHFFLEGDRFREALREKEEGFKKAFIREAAFAGKTYSLNLDVPIRTAAGIIEANMAAGRIPDDGFLLLASVPYDEIGVDRARAELKSRFLSQFAAEVISKEFPELASKMAIRTAVLDWRSRQLETLG